MKKIVLGFAVLLVFMGALSGCSLFDFGDEEPAASESDQGIGAAATEPASVEPVEVEEPDAPQDDAADDQPAEPVDSGTEKGAYPLVDTGQTYCYSDTDGIPCPAAGEAFYGQDAQYPGNQPEFVDNGDGTVTDQVTGLMWQKSPDLENKLTFAEALAGAETFDLGGYSDWRLPAIQELYSLADFQGSSQLEIPYIDTDFFDFRFGDEALGERHIDGQYWSSTEYVGKIFGDRSAAFGFNFADGRIKAYPQDSGPDGAPVTHFVRYVRGNPYGSNDFVDNGDDTISDSATGLMWMRTDSVVALNWQQALNYCESLSFAGHEDWRLPDAKALHSIVDYARAPSAADPTSQGPAIDPLFSLTESEAWFWSSTTHLDNATPANAVYFAFGQAYGAQDGEWVDVHGAGAQRSDPKNGDSSGWPEGRGPQNDQVRVLNFARCVRGGTLGEVVLGGETDPNVQEGSAQPPEDQPSEEEDETEFDPNEARNACDGLDEGDSCEFTGPTGVVKGKCKKLLGQLSCAPDLGFP